MTAFTKSELRLRSGTLPCHIGGSGPALLYLHSAGGVRLSPALEQLAQSFKLYVPVMPGFDGTARRDHLRSMADLADLAAELIDTAIAGPCDVIGHSFGGWVAAWLGAKHADKVQLLTLVAPAGFRPDGAGGLPTDPAALRRAMYAHPENLGDEKPDPQRQAENRAAAHHYNHGVATDRDLVASLGELGALTLILQGTKDGVIPVATPRLLKACIPHAFSVYVYDAAHALDVDQPERFVELVTDFFTRGESFIVSRSAMAG